MHTMQEESAANGNRVENGHTNGYLGMSREEARQPKPPKDAKHIGAAIAGMLLPLVLQVGHAH